MSKLWARLVLVLVVLTPQRSGAQAASSVVDGYRYTMTGTQTAGGMPGRADGTQTMEVRGQVAAGVLRMEYPKGAGPFSRPGVYMLMDSRTNEVVLIDSMARKSVSVSEGMSSAVMNVAAQMIISDTSSRHEDLGPGDVVLGHATRKFRLTIRYTMSAGDVAESKVSTVQITTMHVSEAVTALDPALALATSRAMTPLGQGTPRSALEQTVWELSRKLPKGFALVVEQDVRITSPIMEMASASSMRVTELAPVKLSTATLALPGGLEKVDFLAYMMQAAQAPR